MPLFKEGPLYHAQGRGHDIGLRQWIYWSRTQRSDEFGPYITKAMIWFNEMYDGNEWDARKVVGELDPRFAEKLYLELSEQPMVGEESWEDLARLISERHYYGVWQSKQMLDAISKAGFDAVYSRDPFGGSEEWVVKSPDQVTVLEEYVVPRTPKLDPNGPSILKNRRSSRRPKRTSRRRR